MPRNNLLIIFIALVVSLACYHKADRSPFANIFSEAFEIVTYNYVRPIEQEKLFNAAMIGMTSILDQNSNYIPPREYESFKAELNQNFGGIGIHVSYDEEKEQIQVVTPLAGAPAYAAGIQAGDVIVSIDGTDVTDFQLDDAVKLLRGPIGTKVELGVIHLGTEDTELIDVERSNIKVSSVLGDTHDNQGNWVFKLKDNPKIGYIRVNTFGNLTAEEFADAYFEIESEVDGLIIDLRNNAGGYLSSAETICDMFIDRGVIVSTRGRDGKEREQTIASPRYTIIRKDLPIVVLVNQFSASASEIVAACLQDHDRAIIVGERSFGKGTVQSIFDLHKRDRSIKITTATYWRPSEKNIHRFPDATEEDDWGVSPNQSMEVIIDEEELSELLKSRQLKDIDRSNVKDKERIENREKSEEELELEQYVDPQLQKAIEVIQSRIETN